MVRRVVVGLALAASLAGAATALAADAKQAPDLTGQWRLDPKHSDTMQAPQGQRAGRGMRGGEGGGMGPGGGPPEGGPGMGPGGGGGWGGGGGAWGGGGGGGGWGGGMGRRGGMGGGRRGAGGPPEQEGARERGAQAVRPVRLPELMHVTQTASLVSFEDSTGTVLEEVTTLAGKDTLSHAPGAQVVAGTWKDGALQIERAMGRGGKLTQTISLEKDGKMLVVKTSLPSFGDTPARELKRVYLKVEN